MDLIEYMYYLEESGNLSTRAGKINAVIRDIKRYPTFEISMTEFELILNRHGLTYSELSPEEFNYINRSIK